MNIETTEEKVLNRPITAVDVRFRTSKKVCTFEVDDIDIKRGTVVVAESEMGICLGDVIGQKYIIDNPKQPLKRILRIATEEDIKTDMENRSFEEEAKVFCIERVKVRNLPMKVVTTETTLDRKRLIFYFTADGRIDFRELVRDLAGRFKTRIEMRQIGVRDEVKMIGGIGVCGRVTCCNSFLTSFEPVSIKMVRQQDLTLNQTKLSGICGRLMCCIAYECDGLEERTNEDMVSRKCIECGYEDKVFQEISIDDTEQTEDRGQKIEDREEMGVTGEQETGEKRQKEAKDLQSETQKNENKGKPFSKRKRFLKKRHHS